MMYFALVRKVADAVELLTKAQYEGEDTYANKELSLINDMLFYGPRKNEKEGEEGEEAQKG